MVEKIKELYQKYKEPLLYLIFGVLTTVVNYVTYFLSASLFNFSTTIPPTIIGWVLSVTFAYVTNKIFVFQSNTTSFMDWMREIGSFVSARLLSLGLDAVIMFVSVDLLSWNEPLMKIISNVFVVIINYVFSKWFIFKNKD